MKPTILFVNTGTGRNLGDRAMLLNLMEKLSQLGCDSLLVPRQLPEPFQREFQATPYTPYHECLDRFRRRLPTGGLGKVLRAGCYALHVFVMALACLLCRILPLPLTADMDEIRLLGHLKRSQAVWLSGGGYLTDKGRYECRCCLLTAVFAILMGKKVVLSGQGIGPINSWITQALLRFVTRHAAYVSVRDDVRSVEFLTRITSGKVNIVMAGDDASSLATPNSVSAVDPLPAPSKEKWTALQNRPVRIAIHFRISPFTENSQRLKEQFAETIAHVFERGWRPVFFIFTSQAEWEQDILSSLLKDAAPNSYDIIASADPRHIKSQIAGCDLALGIAYHFVVFSLTTGTPVIALYGGEYYRCKMSGILKQYGKKAWLLEFCDFTPTIAISTLANCLIDLNSIHTELNQHTQRITDHHQHSIQSAFGAI